MVFRTMSPDEIRYWYTEELSEAFAPNERKPLQDILMLQNEGRYELWGLFDAAQMAGYATIWKAPGIALGYSFTSPCAGPPYRHRSGASCHRRQRI